MPVVNLLGICAVCQKAQHQILGADVTSMVPGEQIDAMAKALAPLGWAVRRHADKKIGRYLVCPGCLQIERDAAGNVAREPYDKNSLCRKCGFDAISTTYRSGLENGLLAPVEHMERQCERCGFKFVQAPLDAALDKAPTVSPGAPGSDDHERAA